MVPQDSLLFEGTIAENISLNDPTADDISIIRAATIACAHEFIMSLPQGYATRVAERGSNLSGGQRQRIAIARTILDNPTLLIMDEATSALDYETERMVCMNIQEWAKKKNCLIYHTQAKHYQVGRQNCINEQWFNRRTWYSRAS